MKHEEAHEPTGVLVTGDGSPTFHSERFGEAFHSGHGAVSESLHVFVGASGVRDRLEANLPVSVLEVGFGLGLNFALTAELALAHGTPLRYVALERELQPAKRLEELDYSVHAPRIWSALLHWREQLQEPGPAGLPVFRFVQGSALIELQIVTGDAARLVHGTQPAGLQLPSGAFSGPFDAVYQDAFSPAVNPELWSPAFLAGLLSLLKDGGRLVTYSVKGSVRRCLEELGADVVKQPGPPGGKREMLLATRPLPDSAPGDE
jgi:tRNA U34 5-methylaminomethyl-2-thiouridine-forming methyltransferase MnmC